MNGEKEMMKFVAFGLIGILLGYFIFTCINAISSLVFGLVLGYQFQSFSFFGVEIVKMNGKLKIRTTNISFAPTTLMIFKKHTYAKRLIWESSQYLSGILVIVVLFLYPNKPKDYILIYWALLTTFIIIYIWGLFILAKMIRQMYGKSEYAVFWREKNEIMNQLQEGIPPKDLDFTFKPSEAKFEKNIEYMQYELIRYYKALQLDDKEGMKILIHKFENYIPSVWNIIYTLYFYELVFYYAYVERDLLQAQNYANVVMEMMERDQDSNGCRVYAYYLYYTGKNKKLALEIANKVGIFYLQ